jgi:hypothetical protein
MLGDGSGGTMPITDRHRMSGEAILVSAAIFAGTTQELGIALVLLSAVLGAPGALFDLPLSACAAVFREGAFPKLI